MVLAPTFLGLVLLYACIEDGVKNIICSISASKWMSLVQFISKKTSITLVKNEKNKLVPTKYKIAKRVCIEYRR